MKDLRKRDMSNGAVPINSRFCNWSTFDTSNKLLTNSQQDNERATWTKVVVNHSPVDDLAKDFKEAFSLFDPKGQGFISSRDLGTVMRNLGHNPSEQEVSEMIKQVDVDGNGQIDFSEFVQMMRKQMRTHDTEQELREAFDVFDKNRNGKISPCELKTVMKSLGEELSRDELKEMMKEADTNGDGFIDFDEFICLVKTLDQTQDAT